MVVFCEFGVECLFELLGEELFVFAADFDDDADLFVGAEFGELFDVDVVEGFAELVFELFEVDWLFGGDGGCDAAGEADVFLHDVACFGDGVSEDDEGEEDDDGWDDEHFFVVLFVDVVECVCPCHRGWCVGGVFLKVVKESSVSVCSGLCEA